MLPRVTTIEPPAPADDHIATAEDIAELNRMAVERSAAFARVAGAVVLVVGVFGALAWLWLTVRLQLRLDDRGSGVGSFGDLELDTSFLERIDVASSYVELLVVSALAGGLGLGLRAAADYLVARTGGSLTGYRVGDDLSTPDDHDDLVLERTDPPGA
jgi:hypothetical protein